MIHSRTIVAIMIYIENSLILSKLKFLPNRCQNNPKQLMGHCANFNDIGVSLGGFLTIVFPILMTFKRVGIALVNQNETYTANS